MPLLDDAAEIDPRDEDGSSCTYFVQFVVSRGSHVIVAGIDFSGVVEQRHRIDNDDRGG